MASSFGESAGLNKNSRPLWGGRDVSRFHPDLTGEGHL
jgi:hypothetical protein